MWGPFAALMDLFCSRQRAAEPLVVLNGGHEAGVSASYVFVCLLIAALTLSVPSGVLFAGCCVPVGPAEPRGAVGIGRPSRAVKGVRYCGWARENTNEELPKWVAVSEGDSSYGGEQLLAGCPRSAGNRVLTDI